MRRLALRSLLAESLRSALQPPPSLLAGARQSGRRRASLRSLSAVLLVVAGSVPVTPQPAAAATLVQVSASPAQTIHNIGASGAWWVNDIGRFSAANQQRVADLLFGAGGLQLSAFRYNIGGGGVGVADTDRRPQTFLVSPGNYDWTRDAGGVRFLRYADQFGVPTIVGFVNSAPPVWTTNSQSCGGTLRAGSEQAFATYLADVFTHFDAEGVRMTHVSPMNEPNNSFGGSPCSQEGMLVPVAQRDDLVRAVGTTFASRAPWAGIIADESSSTGQFNTEAPQWINQAGTAGHVAMLAHHTYDFPSDGTRAAAGLVGKRFGKPTWATEICCFNNTTAGGWGQGFDPTITGALNMASIMHRDFTVAGDSAFHWWTAVSKVMGCSPGANASCATATNTSGWNDGLIYYDPQFATNGNQTLYLTKRYYAMAHYSRFVRPGSVRHNVTGVPTGVQVLATSQGGNWTLVINNTGTAVADLDVHFNALENVTPTAAFRTSATQSLATIGNPTVANGTVTVSLPARSISTYVLRQNGGAPVTPNATSRWIGQSAGRCLDVSGGSTANGANMHIWDCHTATNQQWTLTAAGELRVYGNKCLEAVQAGTAPGTRVSIFDCTGGNHQKWTVTSASTLTNRQSNLCLDVNGQGTANGSGIILWTCTSGATNQIWRRA
jgi:O-glycosyl hydrolase